MEKQFECVVCEAPIRWKGELCKACEAECQAADKLPNPITK